jgi:hypothetical protein
MTSRIRLILQGVFRESSELLESCAEVKREVSSVENWDGQEQNHAEGDPTALLLKAYAVHRPASMVIVPASADRSWMDGSQAGFANRCLPLRIANQSGWMMLNQRAFEVIWNGGKHTSDLEIRRLARGATAPASSHFGYGILTWNLPYVFRTPPGYNLRVRGPVNWCKDGAWPLEGIVETDWSVASITMNWKITRVGAPIRFDEAEPICMIYPEKRGEVECFVPEIESLDVVPDLKHDYGAWSASRSSFNRSLPNLDANSQKWEKHYYIGMHPASPNRFPDHQVKLKVSPFLDRRTLPEVSNGELLHGGSRSGDCSGKEDEIASDPEPIRAMEPAKPALVSGALVVNDFLDKAQEMRLLLDRRFAAADSVQIWTYRFAPGSFSFLQMDPAALLPGDLLLAFAERLRAWSNATLGLSEVSVPVATAFIDGCNCVPLVRMNEAKFQYVFSLTRWSKREFSGGETILAKPSLPPQNGFFGGINVDRLFGLDLNQLLIFEAHLAQGTRELRGARTPAQGSILLEGYIQ